MLQRDAVVGHAFLALDNIISHTHEWVADGYNITYVVGIIPTCRSRIEPSWDLRIQEFEACCQSGAWGRCNRSHSLHVCQVVPVKPTMDTHTTKQGAKRILKVRCHCALLRARCTAYAHNLSLLASHSLSF